MTGNDIRSQFLEYFKDYDHQVVRSSSLVPQDDPTLLFTNAGMVQFKRIFLGEEKRGYARATTSQKCVRAGGKHNDLENVGYTARHHTFFEMLGNFSFGDYFKQRAVTYAWDLLVNGYRLPQDRLWVSIYLDDDEAFDLWHREVGVPRDRIVRFGEKDNFWSMGDTGPCGPCSEILIDRGEAFGCDRPDCRVGCECDRYLEIWNLVFMQFNRDASGQMNPLPKPSIDTGMGLERIVSVLQDTPSNYETDLILPIIHKASELSGQAYGEAPRGDVALKVIADHSRSAAFLIGDGVLPSNEGRGYVLRRIMRRAIRYGRNIGLTRPFLHQTAAVVFDIMKPAYPELADAAAFITKVIHNEEQRFSETLDHGLSLLNDTLGEMKAKGERIVSGHIIFKLYDTYGFPVDIVRDVIRDEDFELDMEGFEAGMAAQRAQSRTTAAFTEIGDAYRQLSGQGIKPAFVGYDTLSCEGRVLLLAQDGHEVQVADADQCIEIVTDTTPFYGEAGGQVGDTGRITGPEFEVTVSGTLKDPTGITIHRGQVTAGRIRKGDRATLAVDAAQRAATARNHTATHLLHAVLHQVLGSHVKQAGSLVAPDRLRFDFSHFSQVDSETLDRIETLVNAKIRENIPTAVTEMAVEDALKSGAKALFEEKYGDRVRVISLERFSRELCGGTHTRHTGDIGLFRVIGEASVASGVRRIEALTGEVALAHVQQAARTLRETARLTKVKPDALFQRVGKLLEHQKTLEKELEQLKAQMASASVDRVEEQFQLVDGIKVLARRVAADSPAALRELADKLKAKIGSGVVVLGSVTDGKVLLVASVTPDLVKRCHAGNMIKQVAEMVGGSGGGRPDMAQAGGNRPEKLDQALDGVPRLIAP